LVIDICVRLEFTCTNNQAEYESLMCGLDYLEEMGIKSVEAFGDSKLVVQQLNGDSQCLGGVLNLYHDECLGRIRSCNSFCITHIPREDNKRADALAQQASSYQVNEGLFFIKERLAWQDTHMYNQRMVCVCTNNDQKEEGKRPAPLDAQGTGSVKQGKREAT
jgi:hypothetical protein